MKGRYRGTRVRPMRAFSLVETVIVVVMLAIWAGIAIPRVADTIHHHRVDTAIDRVSRDLRLARERARTSSGPVQVTFDTVQDRYQIGPAGENDVSASAYEVDLKADPYGVDLAWVWFNGTTTLSFDGYGLTGTQGYVLVFAGNHWAYVWVDTQTERVIRK